MRIAIVRVGFSVGGVGEGAGAAWSDVPDRAKANAATQARRAARSFIDGFRIERLPAPR
jgi:hypothetical protein